MSNSVPLNLHRTERRIYSTAISAEDLTRNFLAKHPWSPQFLASPIQRDAIAAMEVTLQLVEAFNDKSSFSDHEKQQTYLQFVNTMDKLSKSPGIFAQELHKHGLMDSICKVLGVLFYNRPEVGEQIKKYLDDHLRLMKNAWPAEVPKLDKSEQFRP